MPPLFVLGVAAFIIGGGILGGFLFDWYLRDTGWW